MAKIYKDLTIELFGKRSAVGYQIMLDNPDKFSLEDIEVFLQDTCVEIKDGKMKFKYNNSNVRN